MGPTCSEAAQPDARDAVVRLKPTLDKNLNNYFRQCCAERYKIKLKSQQKGFPAA